MENFSLARTYLFWCGIAKVTTAPSSEITIPDFGVAKGFTSTLGAWTACGSGNLFHYLPCLSLRVFSGSDEGDASKCFSPPMTVRCRLQWVKLNPTNMHNRFCLWGMASAKWWLGLNTLVVTEFIWRSVLVPHTPLDVTPSALSIWRHHSLMSKEQT